MTVFKTFRSYIWQECTMRMLITRKHIRPSYTIIILLSAVNLIYLSFLARPLWISTSHQRKSQGTVSASNLPGRPEVKYTSDKDRIENCMANVLDELLDPFLLQDRNTTSPAIAYTQPPQSSDTCGYLSKISQSKPKVYRDVLAQASGADDGLVTLVTHLSLDHLESLAILIDHWQGPISAAVWVPKNKTASAVMGFCSIEALLSRDNILLHLVIEDHVFTFNKAFYPSNYLRNVALEEAKTIYVFLSDVDVIPMASMTRRLGFQLAKRPLGSKQVLVVPTFESLNSSFCCSTIPNSKIALLKLWAQHRIGPFYFKRYIPGYSPIRYDIWKVAKELYKVNFHKQFEPYIVMQRETTPKFNTSFFGLYFDKCVHSLQLHFMGFEFLVAPNIFNIHLNHSDTHDHKADPNFQCMYTAWQDFITMMEEKYKMRAPFVAHDRKALEKEEVELRA
ncbi:hypothetical protein CAPTEDRAFT_190301 [Capitella teleta]|uniref:Uncharacterized protein n=1 Tax=Capitella teleta TaxID=283909 RepID=R7V5J3_CAPTE|nr:hypothetical protein CAPTEDRAFT_190301 [Capitella teleta]|eukprot:ELU13717.1 hypothetical protein CAPTEDRAFT_190301 [Capitella teleta]